MITENQQQASAEAQAPLSDDDAIKAILQRQFARIKPEISNRYLFDIEVEVEQRHGIAFGFSTYLEGNRIKAESFDELVEKINSFDPVAAARSKKREQIEKLTAELAALTKEGE